MGVMEIDPGLNGYLQPRVKPNEAEVRLFLREVNYHCPLCGAELQSHKQKKLSERKFQIAHIYPNSPTEKQAITLKGLKRLGNTCESFENKIALCKNCHGTQDYQTTAEDYLKLLEKKEKCLRQTALEDATATLGLETEIESVIRNIVKIDEVDIEELNYKAVPIANKFEKGEGALKIKVKGYVLAYFTYITDLFKSLDSNSTFNFNILCMQIRTCFMKMNDTKANKNEIFDAMVQWINNKTGNISKEACEAIVSFFIQNCEVFYEITK
ncbi:hypothetical protein MKD14_06190 [[Clostridium] innocuum]|nr:hypothetical protein [[Clostridium] innocuum]